MEGLLEFWDTIKTAADVMKSLLSLSEQRRSRPAPDEAVETLHAKIVEMNGIILSVQSSALKAQAEQSALVERERKLKERLLKFENWETEKSRYELHQMGDGGFAYRLRPEEIEKGEPPYYICANCYEDRKKSILQFSGYKNGLRRSTCPSCKSDVMS